MHLFNHIMVFSIQSSLDAIVDFVYTIAYGINYLTLI